MRKKEVYRRICEEYEAPRKTDRLEQIKTKSGFQVKQPAVRPVQKRLWLIGSAAAAAVVLTAVLLPGGIHLFGNSGEISSQITMERPTSSVNSRPEPENADTAKIPTWEERTLPQRYNRLVLEGRSFRSTEGTIGKERLDKLLCKTTLTGYDETDPNFYLAPEKAVKHTISAEVYAVKSTSQNGLVAVSFEGQEKYYTYISDQYVPENLGDLADAFDLEARLKPERAEYEERRNGKQIRTEYSLTNPAAFWTLLTASSEAKYENPAAIQAKGKTIRVWGSLGNNSVDTAFVITENGYLLTDFGERSQAFAIGAEKTSAFIHDLLQNGTVKNVREYEGVQSSPPQSQPAGLIHDPPHNGTVKNVQEYEGVQSSPQS